MAYPKLNQVRNEVLELSKKMVECLDEDKLDDYMELHTKQSERVDELKRLMKMVSIKKQIDSVFEEMKHCDDFENSFPQLHYKQIQLGNELSCLERPELRGQKCGLCKKKFDGYGNNPSPLKINGQVCDYCNAKMVIPARMLNK